MFMIVVVRTGPNGKLTEDNDETTEPFVHLANEKSSFGLPGHTHFLSYDGSYHASKHERQAQDETSKAHLRMKCTWAIDFPMFDLEYE